MPSERESTTSTGIGACSAASRADWQVPDISDEMCTDTTAEALDAAAASYASRNSCGEGRDVLSGVNDCSASERDSIVTSTPSRYCRPPMTTWSGTSDRHRAFTHQIRRQAPSSP